MPAVPDLMNALVLETHGKPLRLSQVATPRPKPGQALVRVAASGVNPLDVKIRAGAAAHARQPPPAVLGLDLAGTIVALGPGVTRFKVGDEVFGMTGGVGGHPGSLAEYAAVDPDLLALKPQRLTMREAAVVPLVFITAWEGLVDKAGVHIGQSVLVQGGAGGVGQMAIQIALAHGAKAFGVGSASSRSTIERLGAEFIDRSEPVADYVARLADGRGFDIVYDTGGGASLDASFAAVRRSGHVTSCLGWGSHSLAPLSLKAATYSGVFTLLPLLTGEGRGRHGEIMAEAALLASAGKLSPMLDPRRFTLDNVEEAYAAIENGAGRGKLVVDIGEGAPS